MALKARGLPKSGKGLEDARYLRGQYCITLCGTSTAAGSILLLHLSRTHRCTMIPGHIPGATEKL